MCAAAASNYQITNYQITKLQHAPLTERMDRLLEHSSAVLVVLELIEAGAGWCEQNNVAGAGARRGPFHGRVEGFGMDDLGSANLRFDLRRRRADRVYPLHSL